MAKPAETILGVYVCVCVKYQFFYFVFSAFVLPTNHIDLSRHFQISIHPHIRNFVDCHIAWCVCETWLCQRMSPAGGRWLCHSSDQHPVWVWLWILGELWKAGHNTTNWSVRCLSLDFSCLCDFKSAWCTLGEMEVEMGKNEDVGLARIMIHEYHCALSGLGLLYTLSLSSFFLSSFPTT